MTDRVGKPWDRPHGLPPTVVSVINRIFDRPACSGGSASAWFAFLQQKRLILRLDNVPEALVENSKLLASAYLAKKKKKVNI